MLNALYALSNLHPISTYELVSHLCLRELKRIKQKSLGQGGTASTWQGRDPNEGLLCLQSP